MDRRRFISHSLCGAVYAVSPVMRTLASENGAKRGAANITLLLTGDVMTGRGIDQALHHSTDPRLYESYVRNARVYVDLAKRRNGPFDEPLDYAYPWGDALDELAQLAPDVRIVNLETALTTSDTYARIKGIHYRMHPKNVPLLSVAKINCCVVANNHVLDFGQAGLHETLRVLHQAGINTTGAGRDLDEAIAPAILARPGGQRILVFGVGIASSGIPASWAAQAGRAGINWFDDVSADTLAQIRSAVASSKRQGDIVVLSIHWGKNWGYDIPATHQAFAHELIDLARVDIVHGHSSHHALAMEVYKGKLILYGCGDLLNDYEGITGHEQYRGDLTLLYLPSVNATSGELTQLLMIPLHLKRFRLNHVGKDDAKWLRDRLNREGKQFHVRVDLDARNHLELRW